MRNSSLTFPRIALPALLPLVGVIGGLFVCCRTGVAEQATQASGSVSNTTAQPGGGAVWLGSLDAGGQTLRIQIHGKFPPTDGKDCKLDSVDQKAFGIPCAIESDAKTLTVRVPGVSGKWTGELSADGKTLTGTWSQGGGSLPLVLTQQATAIDAPPNAEKTTAPEAARPPVPVAELKAVLDEEMKPVLTAGALAPETQGGVTIGVVQHGVRRILSYGTAKADSVYEIGSITKTFTGLILAQMVEQGKVRFDEPVRQLLPTGTVAKPATGAEITLLDLSDQHSGLPRMPDNFHPADASNPYADYNDKLLYAFMGKQGVALPEHAPFGYSNLGVGLLGQALADRAGVPYATLLHDEVTGPLNMNETAIALTPEMKARFIEGHSAEDHKPAHAWDLDALAGAGGIRSTAADMLTYLEAQLHPDKLPAAALTDAKGKTLPAAIAEAHTVRADVGGGMHIALNWFRMDDTGSYWHNGGTGGYSSYALFNPEKDFALVVLSNTSPDGDMFTDKLGQHVAQRLSGLPAVALVRDMPKAVAIDPKLLDGYVGKYALAPDFVLTFTREGDQLFTQATGQPKFEVFPESDKTFFLKVVEAKVTFVTDASGKATSVILHQGGRDQEAKRVP